MDIKELRTAFQKELALVERNVELSKQSDPDSYYYWTGYLAALNYADDLLTSLVDPNTIKDYTL